MTGPITHPLYPRFTCFLPQKRQQHPLPRAHSHFRSVLPVSSPSVILRSISDLRHQAACVPNHKHTPSTRRWGLLLSFCYQRQNDRERIFGFSDTADKAASFVGMVAQQGKGRGPHCRAQVLHNSARISH